MSSKGEAVAKLRKVHETNEGEPDAKLRKVNNDDKSHGAAPEVSLKGQSKRYRNWVGQHSEFPPERERYHLYISYACPWASRCSAVYYMKGLEDVIGLSVTHPTWQRTRPNDPTDSHRGWVFRSPKDPPLKQSEGHGSFDCEDCIPDTVNGFDNVRQLYEASNDTVGKYSVPLLWDKKQKCIVNNESLEIAKMLNSEFNEFAKNPDLDLDPSDLDKAMEMANSWVFPNINDGVYKCGFARTQEAYDAAIKDLYDSLEKADALLSKQRYICGDRLTISDLCLFVTLIIFDEVCVVCLKCNVKCLREFPNIYAYVRDIFQTPGVAKSVNMKHIKTHYFSSHLTINTYAIIPKGPNIDFFAPHDRDKM